jgi:hypothetical protein
VQEALTRLGYRRPGTSISFLDGPTEEVILRIAADAEGHLCVKFHLYDSKGQTVAELEDVLRSSNGIHIQSDDGEMLLDLPAKEGENICYRLYNRKGELLTSSDGVSTKIGPCLRMEAFPRGGFPQGSRQAKPA